MTSDTDHLPHGWASTTVGELVEFEYGKSLIKHVRDSEGTYLVFGSNGPVGRHSDALVKEPCLIVGRKGAIGRVHISELPCWPIDTTYYVMPSAHLDLRFVFHLLTSLELGRFDRSTAIPGLNRDDAYSVSTLLPPLSEQRRIAAKIEELLTQLDAGIGELHKAQAQLKRYRQAVLKAAVTGELTREWREAHKAELEPASELLARILTERRAKWEAAQIAEMEAKGAIPRSDDWKKRYPEPNARQHEDTNLPEKWIRTDLDHLCVVVRGASPRPAGSPKYFGGDIPWITVGSLTADKKPFLTSISEFVTKAGCEASRYITPDTLLLTNSGATLGVPKITMIAGCINDGSVALLHLDYPLKLYLYYCLSEMTKRLRQINQGAAQPNLNTGIVKAIEVLLPPAAEQEHIVSHLESIISVTESGEQSIERGLKQAERMRQSILKKAFEGKLVPQDPNDEPADVLLERIKIERANREAEQLAAKPTRKGFAKKRHKRTEGVAA